MTPGFSLNESNEPIFINPSSIEAEAEMLAEWNGTDPYHEMLRLEEASRIQEEEDAEREEYESYEDHSINCY